MKVAIFDIETSGFSADFNIVLAICVKLYGVKGVKVFRADSYESWKKDRANNEPIIKDFFAFLKEKNVDILVAHNGESFDRRFLMTSALGYGMTDAVRYLRQIKTIDPCRVSRRYLKLGRNALGNLISHLHVQHAKTHVDVSYWRKAVFNGDKQAMDYITQHCVLDVRALEEVYDKMRPLIDKIDKRGSEF